MSLIDRILPMPFVTVAIIGLWMTIVPDWSLGHLLLASFLGVLLPWLTKDFWPDRPHIAHPWTGIVLFAHIVGDIIVANIHVAQRVLGSLDDLNPDFIEVPIDIDDRFVSTLLGAILSLAPGTVTIEIDQDRNVMLVHVLHLEDADKLIATIKSRYEAPLKEIFQC